MVHVIGTVFGTGQLRQSRGRFGSWSRFELRLVGRRQERSCMVIVVDNQRGEPGNSIVAQGRGYFGQFSPMVVFLDNGCWRKRFGSGFEQRSKI
jgi:hypothetical protein